MTDVTAIAAAVASIVLGMLMFAFALVGDYRTAVWCATGSAALAILTLLVTTWGMTGEVRRIGRTK